MDLLSVHLVAVLLFIQCYCSFCTLSTVMVTGSLSPSLTPYTNILGVINLTKGREFIKFFVDIVKICMKCYFSFGRDNHVESIWCCCNIPILDNFPSACCNASFRPRRKNCTTTLLGCIMVTTALLGSTHPPYSASDRLTLLPFNNPQQWQYRRGALRPFVAKASITTGKLINIKIILTNEHK